MRFKLALLLLVMFLSFLGTGCWDAEEVSDRIIVLAIGLDTTEHNRVKVSAQVPLVEELLPISKGSQVVQPFSLLSAEGETAFTAVPGLQAKTQFSLFYGQIKTIIIGKDLAEKGITGAIDALSRHTEVPPQAFVLLTKGKAHDLLNYNLWHKGLPATGFVKFFHAQEKGDQSFAQPLWKLARNINSKTQDAFLPLLAYDQAEKAFILGGLGVFHSERLVGELSAEEARMFGLLTGRSQNAYLHLTVPNYGRMTFRRVKAKPRTELIKNSTETVFKINIQVAGSLGESITGKTNLSREDTRLIEREVGAYLHRGMVKTLAKLQSLNSDLLALGEEFRVKYPLKWEKIRWEQVYPEGRIELSVHFKLLSFGVYR